MERRKFSREFKLEAIKKSNNPMTLDSQECESIPAKAVEFPKSHIREKPLLKRADQPSTL